MIRASKIIPIVDDNRQFQGISLTVYDNKIRKRIRLETYKGKVRYNLQDIAVMCGLQEIDSISDYVVVGYDFWIKSTTLLRKKTPEKKLVSKDTVIKFLKENQYNYIDFIEKAESVYYLYLEWYLNPQKKRESLEAYKEKHRQEQKKYIERNFKEFTIKNRLKARKYLDLHKDDEEFKERRRQSLKKHRENNLEKYREQCRISEKKYREKEEVREHYKQYQKEYWIKHREELREKNRLYRLKKKQEKEA